MSNAGPSKGGFGPAGIPISEKLKPKPGREAAAGMECQWWPLLLAIDYNVLE
jgi:hypothetical protein